MRKSHKHHCNKILKSIKPYQRLSVSKYKKCVVCGKIFKRTYGSNRQWLIRIFCSRQCSGVGSDKSTRAHRKHTEEEKIIIGLRNSGKNNGMWAGDKVGYFAIHGWTKRYLKKPTQCQKCGEVKKLDLANISQQYKRELSDWEWLCRRCHMIKDGRMNSLIQRNKNYVQT